MCSGILMCVSNCIVGWSDRLDESAFTWVKERFGKRLCQKKERKFARRCAKCRTKGIDWMIASLCWVGREWILCAKSEQYYGQDQDWLECEVIQNLCGGDVCLINIGQH